jgi:hypothetical protein
VGRVRLTGYPNVLPGALERSALVHTGAVARVRWSAEDEYVVSIGQQDRCILQWRVVRGVEDPSGPDPGTLPSHPMHGSVLSEPSYGSKVRAGGGLRARLC